MVARNVLAAVKARHALTVVDIGAVATEATAIAAEMATQVLVVTTPGRARAARRAAACASCGSDSACARTRTCRSCSTGPRGGARSSPTWRARSSATRWPRRRSRPTSARSRRRSTPARRARWRTASCAARSRRWPSSSTCCRRSRRRPASEEPRGLLARLGGERGQTTVEFIGLLPASSSSSSRSGRSRSPATRTSPPGTPRARARASCAVDPSDTSKNTALPQGRARRPARRPGASSAEIEQARQGHGVRAPEGPAAVSRASRRRSRSARRPTRSVEDEALPERQTDDPREEQVRRGRELELMLRRLLSRASAGRLGRADGDALVDAAVPRSWSGSCCSPPGPSTRRPTPRAPPAASTARGGDAEKAAHYAVSDGLRNGRKVELSGETAKVSVRIPIVFPGLGDDHLRVHAAAPLLPGLTMGLRDRIVADRCPGRGRLLGRRRLLPPAAARGGRPQRDRHPLRGAAPRPAGARRRPHGLARGPRAHDRRALAADPPRRRRGRRPRRAGAAAGRRLRDGDHGQRDRRDLRRARRPDRARRHLVLRRGPALPDDRPHRLDRSTGAWTSPARWSTPACPPASAST